MLSALDAEGRHLLMATKRKTNPEKAKKTERDYMEEGEPTSSIKASATGGEANSNLLYSVEDTPAWHYCVVLGVQHYLIAVGGVIAPTIILAPLLCIADDDRGDVARAIVISSLLFVSGICTLLQTTLGVRLPIMQGSSFSFLPPTLAILAMPHNICPPPLTPDFNPNSSETLYNDTDGTIVNGDELWMRRMREIQGAIASASCAQLLLGFTGAVGFLLRFIGPLTVAPAISLIGLSLFSTAYHQAEAHWGIALFTAFVMILCSQFLNKVKVPLPGFTKTKKCQFTWTPIFMMYPALFAIVFGWLLCLIFTVHDVLPTDLDNPSHRARTDLRSSVISNAPWFRFPYPGQWGLPRVTVAGFVGMLAGVFAGMIESVGDYYACAKLSGAPNPPRHAINRGILTEGFGCVLAGMIGTASGTTSFSQNIGAIGITHVGSRRVLQVAGCVFVMLGMFCKFGSIFVAIPDPVLGGLFCVMFGMIAAVGISNLQYVDLNSPRNLFIIGFSLFMGLTVPEWMKARPGAIQTGSIESDQIITVLLQTPMLVGGIIAFILDNTIPGTENERGIVKWRKLQSGTEVDDEEALAEKVAACYDLPFSPNCCRLVKYFPFLPEYGRKTMKSSTQGPTTKL